MSTIELPGGGTAEFRAYTAMTPRQKRRIKPYALALATRLEVIGKAATVTVDGRQVLSSEKLSGPSVTMDLREAELFTDMQDETTLSLLVGWTLPNPLPRTVDELLDVDDTTGRLGLYDALSAESGRLAGQAIANSFSVEAIEDPASPTGA